MRKSPDKNKLPLNLDLALTNEQVFEFIQQKPAIVPLAN